MFDTTISLWRHKCVWEKPQRYVDEDWEYRENAVTTTAFHGLTSNDDHQLHKMACSSSVRPNFVASPPQPWAFKPYDHTGIGCCRMQRFGPRTPKSVQNYHCSISQGVLWKRQESFADLCVPKKVSHMFGKRSHYQEFLGGYVEVFCRAFGWSSFANSKSYTSPLYLLWKKTPTQENTKQLSLKTWKRRKFPLSLRLQHLSSNICIKLFCFLLDYQEIDSRRRFFQ